MTENDLVRGWHVRNGGFQNRVAEYLRQVAQQSADANLNAAKGRPLVDLAEYVQSLSTWDQGLVALENLARVVQGVEGYRPPDGSEQQRTLVWACGVPQNKELLGELIVAASMDAERHVNRAVNAEREQHGKTKAQLEKAERRVLQLEGVESSLMKAKAETAELRDQLEQVTKQRDHLRVLAPEQEEATV